MEDVFGRDGLLADAALGERDVFRHQRVQVVADHQHVEMLGDGVDREGPRGIRRRRQNIRFRGDADDIRRMAAARAFGVIGVDRPAGDRSDGVIHEAGFIDGVGVDRDLYVVTVRHARQASMAAGVVPQSSCSFSPQAPATTCSSSGVAREALPLPRKPKFIGNASAASSIRAMFHSPGVQVVALVPVAGPVPPPIMVVVPFESAS